MHTKRKTSIIVLAIGILVLVCLGTGAFHWYKNIYKLTPTFSTKVFELGEEVPGDKSFYALGSDWALRNAKLDITQVNDKIAGEYKAYLSFAFQRFEYDVIIRDTVSPIVLPEKDKIYVVPEDNVEPSDFEYRVEDFDDKLDTYLEYNGTYAKNMTFAQMGQYRINICCSDSSGNIGKSEVYLVVDTAPEIIVDGEVYAAKGCPIDYLASASAFGDTDGNLSDELVCNASAVKNLETGVYEVIYTVQDSYGLSSQRINEVHILEPEDLQELIANRTINRHDYFIYGAPNLYDLGVMSDENMDAAKEFVHPSVINLVHKAGGGYTKGSGFIIEIDDEYIYICTNEHVVVGYNDWNVCFFEGTSLNGVVVGKDAEHDVGVVKVSRKDVPLELMEQLGTIHMDYDYWESLDKGTKLGFNTIDSNGNVIREKEGTLIDIMEKPFWNSSNMYTSLDTELVHGDSGSAIYDAYGNFVTMVYARAEKDGIMTYWGINFKDVISCYENITGHELYLY